MATLTLLIIGISEILQEVGNVITKHIINSLYHLRFQLPKFIETVTTQYLLEVLDIREISGR